MIGLVGPPRLGQVRLALEELGGACALAGVDDLPAVLAAPVVPADTARHDARLAGLADQGLLPGGTLHPRLAGWLAALALPAALVEVRYARGGTVHRLAVAWPAGPGQVVCAVRHGDCVLLKELPEGSDWRRVPSAFVGHLPALGFHDVSGPAREVLAVLADHARPAVAEVGLRALGAAPAAAEALARALSAVSAHAEVSAFHGGTALPAVSVYDSAHGRVLGVPATAPDGAGWLTLCPGTAHRLADALAGLSPSHHQGRVAGALPGPLFDPS